MRKQRLGASLQITQIINTVPGKGCKPRLWGFHRRSNDKPSLVIVSNGAGVVLRVVKSPPTRYRVKRVK